jgi:hypothetical protein
LIFYSRWHKLAASFFAPSLSIVRAFSKLSPLATRMYIIFRTVAKLRPALENGIS